MTNAITRYIQGSVTWNELSKSEREWLILNKEEYAPKAVVKRYYTS